MSSTTYAGPHKLCGSLTSSDSKMQHDLCLDELHEEIECQCNYFIRLEKMMSFIETFILPRYPDNEKLSTIIEEYFHYPFVGFFLNKDKIDDQKVNTARKYFKGGFNNYCKEDFEFQKWEEPMQQRSNYYEDEDNLTMYHVHQMINVLFDGFNEKFEEGTIGNAKQTVQCSTTTLYRDVDTACGQFFYSNVKQEEALLPDLSSTSGTTSIGPSQFLDSTQFEHVWCARRHFIYGFVRALLNRHKDKHRPIQHCPICFEENSINEECGIPIVTPKMIGGLFHRSFRPAPKCKVERHKKIYLDYNKRLVTAFEKELLERQQGTKQQGTKQQGINQKNTVMGRILRKVACQYRTPDQEEYDGIKEEEYDSDDNVEVEDLLLCAKDKTFSKFTPHLLDYENVISVLKQNESISSMVTCDDDEMELAGCLPVDPLVCWHWRRFAIKNGSLFHLFVYKVVMCVTKYLHRLSQMNRVNKDNNQFVQPRYCGMFSSFCYPNPLTNNDVIQSQESGTFLIFMFFQIIVICKNFEIHIFNITFE